MIWRRAVAVLISVLVTAAVTAAPNDFYTGLLKRGIAHVQAGSYDAAAKELRVAAFGLVDDVDQFEIAQVYLTISAQKLNREPDARHAAQRVLAAERIEQHYATLPLPVDIRAQFEKIVAQILTSDQIAVLHARPPAPIVPAPQPRPVPVPPPTPAPQPKSPAPITTQPVAPIVVPPTPQPQTGKPIISHPAPKTPIELPPAAPRGEVEPPSVPTGPRVTKPAPAPAPAPVPVPVPPPAPAPRTVVPQPPPPVTATADPATADRALEERLRTIEQREARPALSAAELSRRLSAADAALAKDDLIGARTIYRALVQTAAIDHASAMRIGEGSYRARDFNTTVQAFERAGGFRRGEEPYHYYLAVALYETGKHRAAKRELDAALPYIEVTPDVERYRTKINGAVE